MQIAKKIILSILMVMLVLNIIYIPKIFAISDIISDANDFLSEAEEEELPIDQENLKTTSSKIYNILLACGIAVAVVVGAILGITFMLSSVEGKAKIQEALLPYVVGCVVVFGAFTIWKITMEIGNSIESEISVSESGESAQEAQYGRVKCTKCGSVITLDASSFKLRERGSLTCKNKNEDGTICKNKNFIDYATK